MMATALAENGAHKVYIIGRREDKLNEVAARFPRWVYATILPNVRAICRATRHYSYWFKT